MIHQELGIACDSLLYGGVERWHTASPFSMAAVAAAGVIVAVVVAASAVVY